MEHTREWFSSNERLTAKLRRKYIISDFEHKLLLRLVAPLCSEHSIYTLELQFPRLNHGLNTASAEQILLACAWFRRAKKQLEAEAFGRCGITVLSLGNLLAESLLAENLLAKSLLAEFSIKRESDSRVVPCC